MSYTINPNAKNGWVRNAENTIDLSIETDANSVYLDNGRTLEQELGEGSMVSNVSTVDNSMSKVIDGTLDGAYESGIMYGKTMVNGLSNPKISQGGEYITMVSPTHLIINHGENLSEKKINVNYNWFGGKMEDGADYTLDIWILKNTMRRKTDPKASIGKFNFNSYNTGFYSIPANTLGHITYEVTTSKTNTGGNPYIETFTTCEGELEIQIVIRQGKNLTPIEEHFEGICDVKMPILRNVGKNLLCIQDYSPKGTITNVEVTQNTLKATAVGVWHGFEYILQLKPNTEYTFSFERDSDTIKGYIRHPENKGWTGGYGGYSNFTFTTRSTGVIRFTIESSLANNTIVVRNPMIIEGSLRPTSYEDYKTNILHTPEIVTLRSLPNGVRDELDLKTGEYVQRICEVVLDGSESWSVNNSNNEGFYSASTTTYVGKPKGAIISDKLPTITTTKAEGVMMGVSTGKVMVSFNRDSTGVTNINSFVEKLAQNPITVQYELAEPITTIIEPLSVPFAYENGHIILESGFEGQSLLPTLEYSTAINRVGQIQSIANTIQKQEKQITKLEQMLIQNIIDLDYNNTLLTLKNEMEEML